MANLREPLRAHSQRVGPEFESPKRLRLKRASDLLICRLRVTFAEGVGRGNVGRHDPEMSPDHLAGADRRGAAWSGRPQCCEVGRRPELDLWAIAALEHGIVQPIHNGGRVISDGRTATLGAFGHYVAAPAA
jgi:hypothetical protein